MKVECPRAVWSREPVCWHLQALNKKEHKGAMSPESPEPDAIEYNLTPRTEAKYTKIDEEFQMMMQRHQHNGSRVNIKFQMSVGKFISLCKNYFSSFIIWNSRCMSNNDIIFSYYKKKDVVFESFYITISRSQNVASEILNSHLVPFIY